MISGIRSVWGALVGSILILYLPAATGALPAALAVPPFGIIVLLVAFFMPDGISGLTKRTYLRFAYSRKKTNTGAPDYCPITAFPWAIPALSPSAFPESRPFEFFRTLSSRFGFRD